MIDTKRTVAIAVLAASLTGAAHARVPTRADKAFCDRYATYAQDELDAYRTGDAAELRASQQALCSKIIAQS